MKFSQVLVGAGIGVLGSIAVGAILLTSGLFQLGTGKNPSPSPKKPGLLNGPDDLPVLARGGSAEFLSGYKWNPPESGSTAYNTQGVDITDVSMDGVEPCPDPTHLPCDYTHSTAKQVTATASTNWYMKLTFRDYLDRDNSQDYVLLVCSSNSFKPLAQSCDTAQPLSGNMLYLFDAGHNNGNFHNLDPKVEITYDGLFRLAYDVPNCAKTIDANNPHCNHIKTITVAGINFIDMNKQPVTGPFLCRGGACDIGFGKQTQ